jgi:hypothetical protein
MKENSVKRTLIMKGNLMGISKEKKKINIPVHICS